jgi:hypothetical protein
VGGKSGECTFEGAETCKPDELPSLSEGDRVLPKAGFAKDRVSLRPSSALSKLATNAARTTARASYRAPYSRPLRGRADSS